MTNPKPRIVAFAYENPVFEERAASGTAKGHAGKQASPDRTTKLEVGPGPHESEQEPEEVRRTSIRSPPCKAAWGITGRQNLS